MAQLPFVLSFDSPYYGHDVYPNHIYRRLHPRHHIPLDFHTLGLIGRLGAHAHRAHHAGELASQKKDLFEVHLDVGLFQPEEITVKVIDNCVVVEGKHEEREDDHGHIARHFVRRYNLPKGYDPEKIVSTLTADGVLTIRAPKPTKTDDSNEFIVPIKHLGAAELFLHNDQNQKTNQNEKNGGEKN